MFIRFVQDYGKSFLSSVSQNVSKISRSVILWFNVMRNFSKNDHNYDGKENWQKQTIKGKYSDFLSVKFCTMGDYKLSSINLL